MFSSFGYKTKIFCLEHFKKKKERNAEKKKPERFAILKADLPDIINTKTIAVQQGIMEQASCHQLIASKHIFQKYIFF